MDKVGMVETDMVDIYGQCPLDMVNWFSIQLLPHSTGPQINWSPCQCWESCKLEKIASQVFRRKIWDSSDSLFIFIISPLPSPKHF